MNQRPQGHFTTFLNTRPVRGWQHHLRRLRHDARAFGSCLDMPLTLLDATLQPHLAALPSDPCVVRITAYRDSFEVSTRQLPPRCGAPITQVEEVPYRRYYASEKHTDIQPVRELIAAAQSRGYDDILFRCPETGELTEGSFWSLAVLRGGQVRIPVSPDILPSTTLAFLREQTPQLGWQPEHVFRLSDYDGAIALNAVHGVRQISAARGSAQQVIDTLTQQWLHPSS
ncbi:aminotransferase class IV [Corynebacterium sp. TAE3-ERU30]|uniref:aminotransferase class IV n=1 Tax=Corynebacterium sp. TAE3-ERU30 TaxID=2849496 RepID=UPI001C43F194|nr:aminotransferase class IV [Corynebacterium sp. TAE3-ERU30]MBV7281487.1 aminotransferase class IV [Corynebacterium sp. TAE3-ERU30]